METAGGHGIMQTRNLQPQLALQPAVGGHLLDDVQAPHELAVHIQLRVRRPVAELFEALAHVVVRQDVEGVEFYTCLLYTSPSPRDA